MAEQNDKKTKHLRSAKQWLTRAEESFDKDHDVRGELNLFLAKAELQHVQETSSNRGWLKRYPALRHGLALLVAVMFVSVAYGVYYQPDDHAAGRPTPSTMISQPVIRPAPAENNATSLQPPVVAPSSPTSVSRPAKPMVQTAPPQQPAVERRPEPKPIPISEQSSPVSSEEMKNLIRAAGKSLRGE